MDLAALSKAEREALAADPGTEPEVLAELASDFYLLPTLVANPTTPEDTLRGIYRDFPHLRPADPGPLGEAPDDEAAAAIAAFRKRREADSAIENYRRRQTAPRPGGSSAQYVQVLDANGRAVQVPLSALRSQGTNGLAIAAFVLSLVGGSVLAVILGHVAKGQIAQTGENGEGLATAGLVIGYASIALFLLLLVL
jgi:hypothetical protein